MAIKKLTDAAKNEACIKCVKEGETRACHFNGPRQHDFGKGIGVKGHDLMTAEFCHSCDQEFTEGSTAERWRDKWDRSEEFQYWINLTNIRRFNSGIIEVK